MAVLTNPIPHELIRWMEVPGHSHVYALGNFARQVTFASQQARAYNLIWALFNANRLDAGKRVAVVGAGLGGITAVVAALAKNCYVDLFEQASQPCPLQRGNDIRFIHPNILRWPELGSEIAKTDFPDLNWTAANVRGVIKQIDLQWKRRIRKNSRLRQFFNYRVNRLYISPSKSGPQLPWLTANRVVEGNATGDETTNGTTPGYLEFSYDCVILAVGFGEERSVAGVPFLSYWENDSLHQETGRGRRSILVSGCGDGGLIDALRLRLRNFDHAEFVRVFERFADSRQLGQELEAVDHELRGQAMSPDISLQFQARYDGLSVPEEIENYFRRGKRADTTVTLNSPAPGPLSYKASLLNRYATYLAMRFADLHYLSGKVVAERAEGGDFRITLKREDIKMQEERPFDLIIVRHGPQNVIRNLVPETALAEMENWWQHNEDITTKPHWQKNDKQNPHEFFRDFEAETAPPADEVLDLAIATFDSAYREFMRDRKQVQSVAVGEHDGKAGFIVTLKPGVAPRKDDFYAGVFVQFVPSSVTPTSTATAAKGVSGVAAEKRSVPLGIGIYNYNASRRLGGDASAGVAASNPSGIGTLGCFVTDKSGSVFLVSASYVLALDNAGQPGDEIFIEGQSPDNGNTCIAKLTTFSPILPGVNVRNSGMAVARLEPDVKPDFKPVWPRQITRVGVPERGQRVMKIGRTSGLTTGRVADNLSVISVMMSSSDQAWFSDCILINGDDGADFSLSGDGGAAIIRDDGAVVGLLIAAFRGSKGQGGTMASSFVAALKDPVFKHLGLELLSSADMKTVANRKQKTGRRVTRKPHKKSSR